MNYLTELLAFYRWMAENPLSPLLQAYWHLLLCDIGKWSSVNERRCMLQCLDQIRL